MVMLVVMIVMVVMKVLFMIVMVNIMMTNDHDDDTFMIDFY